MRRPSITSKILTVSQMRVLDAVRELTAEKGIPPSLREIQRRLGRGSTNGISQAIDRLIRKGYLDRDPNRSRAVVLCWPPRLVTSSGLILEKVCERKALPS